jgi:hypothetical protein
MEVRAHKGREWPVRHKIIAVHLFLAMAPACEAGDVEEVLPTFSTVTVRAGTTEVALHGFSIDVGNEVWFSAGAWVQGRRARVSLSARSYFDEPLERHWIRDRIGRSCRIDADRECHELQARVSFGFRNWPSAVPILDQLSIDRLDTRMVGRLEGPEGSVEFDLVLLQLPEVEARWAGRCTDELVLLAPEWCCLGPTPCDILDKPLPEGADTWSGWQ